MTTLSLIEISGVYRGKIIKMTYLFGEKRAQTSKDQKVRSTNRNFLSHKHYKLERYSFTM